MTDPVTLINQRAAENYKRMTLKKYNTAEIQQMEAIRDRIKYFLGEELGFDPQTDPEALQEVERRLAHWLLDEHGGEILRESVLNK